MLSTTFYLFADSVNNNYVVMGSYFSSGAKKGEKSGKNGGKSTVEKRRWRYRVVYTDREVKISELPHNMRGLVVMTRTG